MRSIRPTATTLALLVVVMAQVAYGFPSRLASEVAAAYCCLRTCPQAQMTKPADECCHLGRAQEPMGAPSSAADLGPPAASYVALAVPSFTPRASDGLAIGRVPFHDRVAPVFLQNLTLRI